MGGREWVASGCVGVGGRMPKGVEWVHIRVGLIEVLLY